MKYKVGYIDEDPTQVVKYERELRDYFDVIGYKIEKGLALEELLDQVYQSEIDLLMVDYLLVDKGILTYNGDEVARKYDEIKPNFPIIIFTNREADAFPQVDNPNLIYDKGEVKSSVKHFVEKVKKTIELYKNYISKRKETITGLIEKGEKEGLKAEEKHELLVAQDELRNLDKRSVEVPKQLLDEKKIENLAKTTKEAQEFLESLINKKDK
jgi:hypothetical protein